jgi:hypothetical protein
MRALWYWAGNAATQYANWRRFVNIGSCTTPVFVTTCACMSAITAWTWNWSREQTSNSAWNSANLERRLFKWCDVHIEIMARVLRGVSSSTRASREAEYYSKMTRSGRASTSTASKNVETIRQVVHEDRRWTIKDIVVIVNVSYETV